MEEDRKPAALTCNCKKKRCKKCNLCSKCSCACVRTINPPKPRPASTEPGAPKRKRGRPPKCKEQEPFAKRRLKMLDQENRTAITPSPSMQQDRHRSGRISQQQQGRACTPSPTNLDGQLLLSTQEKTSGEATRNGMLFSPRSTAKNFLTTGEKPSTPNIHGLSKAVLYNACADEYAMHFDDGMETRAASLKSTPGPVVHSVGDLAAAFAMDKKYLSRNIGSVASRQSSKDLDVKNPKAFRSMVQTHVGLSMYNAKVLYPGNPKKLVEAGGKEVARVCPTKEIPSEAEEKMAILYSKTKQGSVEKRAIGAALQHSFGKSTLPRGAARANAKQDLQSLQLKQGITRTAHTRQKIANETINAAVKFILSMDNIQPLSWGHRTITLDAYERIELPKVVRKKIRSELWNDYIGQCGNNGHIGKSTFMKLVKAITASDERIVTCVDYVLVNLVNDPVERLQSIIDTFLVGELKKRMTCHLANVRNFLKVHFDKHLMKNDGFGFHDLGHALVKKDSRQDKCPPVSLCTVCGHSGEECAGCKFPFWFCDKLSCLVSHAAESDDRSKYNTSVRAPSMYGDAVEVVQDMKHKFYLYYKHRARVVCQRFGSNNYIQDLRERCRRTGGETMDYKCMIVIDWKQKFDPLSGRETMPENFGKRGIGWHGAAVIFFEWDNETNGPVQRVFYIDQVLDDSNKQDSLAVFSMVEAIIGAIAVNFPHIKEASFISDNAGCYQSKLLIVLFGLLNLKNQGSFYIAKLFHTETQDGKGIVDSHFALAMAHLQKYMKTAQANRIRRINTPQGLAFALAWNNGIANSIVQLISVNRPELETLAALISKGCDGIKKYFSRANEIAFPAPSTAEARQLKSCVWDQFDLSRDVIRTSSVSFKGLAHSEYGTPIGFDVNIAEGKCQPDQAGIDEYERLLSIHKPDDNNNNQEDAGFNNDDSNTASTGDNKGHDVCTDVSDEASVLSGLETTPEPVLSDCSDFEYGYDSGNESDPDSDEELLPEMLSPESQQHGSLYDPAVVGEHRSYSKPTDAAYNQKNMLSGVIVHRTSYIRRQNGTKRKQYKKKGRKRSKDELDRPAQQPMRKDVFAVGVRYARDSLASENIVTDATNIDTGVYDVAKSYEMSSQQYQRGYARREGGLDDLFGARYIEPYEEEIKKIFDTGNVDQSRKAQPAKVLEILQRSHPDTFKLPSEYECRCRMSSHVAKAKKKSNGGDNEGGEDDTGIHQQDNSDSSKVPRDICIWLEFERLPGRVDDRPETIYQDVKRIFPQFDPESKKSLIKRKIGQTKKKMKDTAWRSVL